MSDAERYEPDPADELYEEELRALRAEGSRARPPKPTGTVCIYCVPIMAHGPSGLRYRHAFDCESKPGEPISVREYARGRTWPPVGVRR